MRCIIYDSLRAVIECRSSDFARTTAVLFLGLAIFSHSQLLAANDLNPQEEQQEKVMIGSSPVLTSAGFFVAQEKGYFEEFGIDAEIQIYKSSTTQILPLLATGRLDVGGAGINAGLYNAINAGLGIKLTADKGHHGNPSIQSVVISKKLYPGTIDKETLKGKKFGASKGFPQEIFIELFLKAYGLTLEDVELESIGYPNINPALASGSIFGAAQLEPFLSAALKNDIAVEVKRGHDLYLNQQGGAVIFTKDLMETRPDTAIRFMAAYIKGLRYINGLKDGTTDKREFFEIIKKYTSLDNYEVFRDLILPELNPDGYLNVDSIERDARWYFGRGYINRIPDISEIVNYQFVDKALAQYLKR